MSSLRMRLLVLLIALIVSAAAAVGAITYRNVLREVESLFDYQLQQMALSLRDQGEILPRDAASLADAELDLVVQVWSEDGRTVYASRVPHALPARAVLGFADMQVQGTTWRTFSVLGRQRVIQVAQPRATRQRRATEAALRSIVPLLLLAPLLALAVTAVVTVSLRPLARVARLVRDRDAGDPGSLAPLPVDGLPDEAAPLVRALNALLQRLAAAFDTQRAFVADAAHELRSPLTALRLQLDLLRSAPDATARGQAQAALSAGVERAARLVEQLLTLARIEPGASPVTLQTVELRELARGVLAEIAPVAHARGSRLELQADAPQELNGDEVMLAALLRNLVDNALRYSPPHARVVVGVARDARGVLLTVDDSGAGLSEADRERAFDRFWRRDPGATPGSGLGLAIVRRIAERHRATVTLAGSPLGGLRVTVAVAASAPARLNAGFTSR